MWAVWQPPLYGLGFVGPLLFVFVYTWLHNRTGSVLLCLLLHASLTPALDHLVLTSDDLVTDLSILTTLAAAGIAWPCGRATSWVQWGSARLGAPVGLRSASRLAS